VLTCYRTRRRLGAWLDGALDEATAGSTAAHVGTCAVCQREVGELRRLHTLLTRTAVAAEPDWTAFWPGVVRGIEDRRVQRPRPSAWRRWRPQLAVGAIAAMLLVSVGVWQLGPGGQDTSPLEPGVLVSSASTEDPGATVMVYGPPERDVAVVWVLGLNQEN
jgi:anti-sigma factor RsiW